MSLTSPRIPSGLHFLSNVRFSSIAAFNGTVALREAVCRFMGVPSSKLDGQQTAMNGHCADGPALPALFELAGQALTCEAFKVSASIDNLFSSKLSGDRQARSRPCTTSWRGLNVRGHTQLQARPSDLGVVHQVIGTPHEIIN
jgi:hypothetical protein